MKKTVLFFLILFPALSFAQTYWTVCGDNNNQLCDGDGNPVSRDRYDEVIDRGSYVITVKNGLKGMLNLYGGVELFPCKYEGIYPCANQTDTFLLKENGEYFFYDIMAGKAVTDKFSANLNGDNFGFIDGGTAYLESHQSIVAKKNGKWGAITMKNQVVIPFEYDVLNGYYVQMDDFLYACKNGECFVADRYGKPVTAGRYETVIGYWDPNQILAMKKGKTVLIDRQWQEFSPPDSLYPFNAFTKEGKYAIFNIQGKQLTPYEYDYITWSNSTKYFAVAKNGQQGIIDTRGQQIIPITYAAAEIYRNEDLFVLMENYKYGIADEKANMVLPLEYEYISTGTGEYSMAVIKKDGKFGLFNPKTKKVVAECKYGQIREFTDTGLTPVLYEDKWGFMDAQGKIVVPFKYDQAWYFQDGKSQVKLGDKMGYVDGKGNETWK